MLAMWCLNRRTFALHMCADNKYYDIWGKNCCMFVEGLGPIRTTPCNCFVCSQRGSNPLLDDICRVVVVIIIHIHEGSRGGNLRDLNKCYWQVVSHEISIFKHIYNISMYKPWLL